MRRAPWISDEARTTPARTQSCWWEPGPLETDNHRARLRDLAAEVGALGEAEWGRGPELDLLLRRPPRLGNAPGASLRLPDEEAVDAGRRIALALIDCHLPIQGPPGSGKTYTAAKQVCDLVGAARRVGVTANSHAVIRNLLNEIAKQNELGRPLLIAQKPDSEEVFASPYATTYKQPSQVLSAIHAGNAEVVGATTWLWTREEFRDSVDVLMVDEAGQMSLANLLAAAHAAPNLILLGDPQQLGQPSAAAHPPGAEVSALERVLGDKVTMPKDRGLFIEQSYQAQLYRVVRMAVDLPAQVKPFARSGSNPILPSEVLDRLRQMVAALQGNHQRQPEVVAD